MNQVVGFVGNSIGLSEEQERNLRILLSEMDVGAIRHTNASGAEREAHYLFLCGTDAAIHVHEPVEYYGRAVASPIEPRVIAHFCSSSVDAILAVLASSDVIIFAPVDHTKNEMRKLLSGTRAGQMAVYAAITCRTEPILRTAANNHKKIIILREDGQMIRYN
jgi:hypothetical protein